MIRLRSFREQSNMDSECLIRLIDDLMHECDMGDDFNQHQIETVAQVVNQVAEVIENSAPNAEIWQAWRNRLSRMVDGVCHELEKILDKRNPCGDMERVLGMLDDLKENLRDFRDEISRMVEATQSVPLVEAALATAFVAALGAVSAASVGVAGAVEAAAASLVGAMRDDVIQWLEEGLSPDNIAQRLIDSPQGQERLARLRDEVQPA